MIDVIDRKYTVVLPLLILLITICSKSAIGDDFWNYDLGRFWDFEKAENEELRGGPSLQLNTKPLLRRYNGEFSGIRELEVEGAYGSKLPEVQGRQGRWITNGTNLFTGLTWTEQNRFFTINISGMVDYQQNRSLDDVATGKTHPLTQSLHWMPEHSGSPTISKNIQPQILFPISTFYIFLGKSPLKFGAGKHDTLHLSDSAEPMPMVRFGTLEPFDTWLGSFTFLTFLGVTEKSRDVPEARFSGIRLELSSEKRLEFGLSRSWFAGGQGQDNSLSHTYFDLYSEYFKPTNGSEKLTDFRNQQLVIDFRLKLHEIKTVFYGEWGREDHEHSWKSLGRHWDRTSAYILGLKALDWIPNFFAIFERANTAEPSKYDPDIAWYTHSEYTSGWTHKGVNLGHHMGPDSQDTYVAIGYAGTTFQTLIYSDQEIYGMRNILSQNRVRKKEIGLDLNWEIAKSYQLGIKLNHKKIDNFGSEVGRQLSSYIATINLRYYPNPF